ncbi:MAG: hypothetical protein ACPL5F_07285 [Moorellaceae bacterium]
MAKSKRHKRAAWIRRKLLYLMPGEAPPERAGGIAFKFLRYLGNRGGVDVWEAFGWKPYDATLYRLREHDPRNCPHEAVPLGKELGWEC